MYLLIEGHELKALMVATHSDYPWDLDFAAIAGMSKWSLWADDACLATFDTENLNGELYNHIAVAFECLCQYAFAARE